MFLSEFTFFKYTPLTDFMNTIHFPNDNLRDYYFFDNNNFTTITYQINNYNFIREKSTIRVSGDYVVNGAEKNNNYTDFDGVNYLSFYYGFNGVRYYANVTDILYVTDNCVEIEFVIDGVMTFCQGNTLVNSARNITIERQHLTKSEYTDWLPIISTNDDIIATSSKKYVYKSSMIYKNLSVIFTCASDLSVDFGTIDDPNIITSKGQTYDKITSPLNLYVMTKDNFSDMMQKIAKFPWTTQNIKRLLLFPTDLIDEQALENVTNVYSIEGLKKFKNDALSNWKVFDTENVNLTIEELCDIHELDKDQDLHILRDGYTTIEFYSWDGQQVTYNPAFLDKEFVDGLKMRIRTCIGYHNEFAFYCENYKSDYYRESESPITDKVPYGSFLNDAIIFQNFDEIPVLVDQGTLNMANTANQRKFAESQLISNRLKTVFAPDTSLQDRFYNAVSVLSNINPLNLLGKFSDEHTFYKQQQAEFADNALQTPTLTNQTSTNSFSIANDIFGITLKIASPSYTEMEKVKKYYKSFGYETRVDFSALSDINSMKVCNYVQFSGQWEILKRGITPSIMEQIRLICENGLRLWHYDGTQNPLNQNIMENVMIR